MHTNRKFAKPAALGVLTGLLVSLSTFTAAESDAARAIRASAATVPTNIAGIRAYAEPPKGFNAVTASDEDLATYGFPPRPDKQADPDRYARWERAMQAAKIHWNGELKELPFHGREVAPGSSLLSSQDLQPVTSGPKAEENVSASGVIVNNKLTSWNDTTSFDNADLTIGIPKAQLPVGNGSCAASDYKAFSFAGIDSTVYPINSTQFAVVPGLQAGVYGDVPCGSGAPFYFAEFGFGYPLYRAFAVNPGDVVYVEVYSPGPSQPATALVEDFMSGAFSTYSISTPSIIGRNADWLVFRPCCDASGYNFPLANTVNIFVQGVAYTANNKAYYPGSQASTTNVLTMTDDAGDQNIEQLYQGNSGREGLYGLTFYTNGCAYSGGCTP